MTDIMQKIEAVNTLLLAGEPGNISTDEHSGYTGYKPQSLIDALNQALGIGAWGFEEVSSDVVPGDKGSLAIAQVSVWLKDIDFKPTSWGQNRVTRGDLGDARKGAQTDAIKKAFSYFSIGNRAYHGLLKEGNSHTPVVNATRKPPQPTNNSTQSPPLLEMIGKAKNRAKLLGQAHNKEEWEAFLQECTGEALTDKDITLDRIARVNGHLTQIERDRQSTVKKAS